MLERAYHWLYLSSLIFLGILVLLTMVRAIKGPRVADRILAVNMIGTQIIVSIAILVLMLKEGYLADIAIIYAMISFLAVVVLCKVYMGVYLERAEKLRLKALREAAQKEGTADA